jgi:YTH domain-containing protein 1
VNLSSASEDQGQELSINELISQYSGSKPAPDSNKRQREHGDWCEEDESWTNITPQQSRRDLRYQDKEHPKPDFKNEQKWEEVNRSAPEQRPPTLAQMLTHVEDSREWLEVSSYKNAPKRDKILSRQREIAALDAERDKLIAEIKAEGPVILPAVGNHSPNFAMLPPAASKKFGHRAAPVPKSERGTAAMQCYRVVSSKRRYSDVQDDRAQASLKKVSTYKHR